MRVYNTLSRQKEEFIPIEENKVKMYVCGPTVYNFIHIGNARPFVTFDTIRRYLEHKGYDVTYVQNFTDIDDKIIQKAIEENVSAKEISERYIQEILVDAEGLNVKKPTFAPKVTEEIEPIIEMIQSLIQKGVAYEINGTVYFSTETSELYGKLSRKNIEDLEAGTRIDVDEEKKNPMDFVLWKPKKEGEPAWASPWGEGRPGWHIECSVMAKKYLGKTIDIHAGGEDLVFPHHENEIAQSEAANGKQFAKYWLHNAFLNVDNQKMSKSKGNFFTLRDVVQEFPYDVIRFFILSVHYRSPINFSRDILQAAENGLTRIKKCASNLAYMLEQAPTENISAAEKALLSESQKYAEDFDRRMDDDFNTADALAAIFELVTFTNKNVNENSSKEFVLELQKLLQTLSDILGISLEQKKLVDTEEIEKLIEERQQAKKNKDFKRADQIRDDLAKKGILLEDTRSGVRYSFVD